MDDLWQPLVYAALAGAAFAPLEWLLPERDAEPDPDQRQRLLTDVSFATLGALLTQVLLAGAIGVVLTVLVRVRPVELGLPGWASLALGLLIFELGGYAYHRAAHASPLLWRLHVVHHSAPRMDWLASFRQHPVEIVLMTLVQNIPLVLLGVPIGAHALVVVLLALNTVFVHANLRVDHPALRWLLATPRFHHRHHDRDARPANFASLLPILDRVFGTYAGERARVFGVDEAIAPTFWGLLIHPLRGTTSTSRPKA